MATSDPTYHRPERLEEALRLLGGGVATVLAGGTDLYPAHLDRPLPGPILDLAALEALRAIRLSAEGLVIGATATWSEVARAELPPGFRALQEAARQVGALAIQNAGTVGGNVCNASPAADGVPPMLALDAEVLLASAGGERALPLGRFVLGNRRTARRPDELVTGLRFPLPSPRARSRFLKLGHRSTLVISIAMVAVAIDPDEAGRVARAAVAVGACSPVARRLEALERRLQGKPAGPGLAAHLQASDLEVLSPIDDVRASAAYRREVAGTLVRRALAEVLS